MALIRHINVKKFAATMRVGVRWGGVGHERDINETRADSVCEFCITEYILICTN